MEYPRPIREIHQIELSTFCNLRCKYCPYPWQEKLRNQPKMHMDWRTFERAIEWAVRLNGSNKELSLTGVGEALLHPEFVNMLAYARECLPDNPLVFSTNGLLLTEELCETIARYRPQIYVSMHHLIKSGPAVEAAKKYGLLAGVNNSPATSAFDWAGQVPNWYVSAPKSPCEYLRSGWAVVLVDGRITTCCLDASAKGVVGHVDDPIESLTIPGTGLKPFSLCEKCHMWAP